VSVRYFSERPLPPSFRSGGNVFVFELAHLSRTLDFTSVYAPAFHLTTRSVQMHRYFPLRWISVTAFLVGGSPFIVRGRVCFFFLFAVFKALFTPQSKLRFGRRLTKGRLLFLLAIRACLLRCTFHRERGEVSFSFFAWSVFVPLKQRCC